MHACYVEGDLLELDPRTGYTDYAWVTKNQLKQFLSPSLKKLANKMLVVQ